MKDLEVCDPVPGGRHMSPSSGASPGAGWRSKPCWERLLITHPAGVFGMPPSGTQISIQASWPMLRCLLAGQETNQEVPSWLAGISSRSSPYGQTKRRGGGSRFGGRDFRRDNHGGGGGGGYGGGGYGGGGGNWGGGGGARKPLMLFHTCISQME